MNTISTANSNSGYTGINISTISSSSSHRLLLCTSAPTHAEGGHESEEEAVDEGAVRRETGERDGGAKGGDCVDGGGITARGVSTERRLCRQSV